MSPFPLPRRLSVAALLVAGVALAATLGYLEEAQPASGGVAINLLTVNTAADHAEDGCDSLPDDCTLREAISEISLTNDAVTINFSISGAGPHVIDIGEGTAANAALPLIGALGIPVTVTINGTSEPDYAGTPVVVLDGSLVTDADADGLNVVNAEGGAVRGLAVVDFPRKGIFLTDSDDITVEDNYIGVDPNGTTGRGNGEVGIQVFGEGNEISENVVSDNGSDGIVDAGGAGNNVYEANKLGPTRQAPLDLATPAMGSTSMNREPRSLTTSSRVTAATALRSSLTVMRTRRSPRT